jgi:hypothetical protein
MKSLSLAVDVDDGQRWISHPIKDYRVGYAICSLLPRELTAQNIYLLQEWRLRVNNSIALFEFPLREAGKRLMVRGQPLVQSPHFAIVYSNDRASVAA